MSRSNSSGSLQSGLQVWLWNASATRGSIAMSLTLMSGSVEHWHGVGFFLCDVHVEGGVNGGSGVPFGS